MRGERSLETRNGTERLIRKGGSSAEGNSAPASSLIRVQSRRVRAATRPQVNPEAAAIAFRTVCIARDFRGRASSITGDDFTRCHARAGIIDPGYNESASSGTGR